MLRVPRNRREFLRECSQAAGCFLIPGQAGAKVAEFHLHPSYREQTALDSAFLKIKPGPDRFPLEQEHDRLASILSTWSKDLFAVSLHPQFLGGTWRPIETRPLRAPSNELSVMRLRFSSEATLQQAVFLQEMESALRPLSKLVITELQITRLEASEGRLMSTIRYEIVGSGTGFHLEQRIGTWLIQWENLQPIRWQMEDETRSRSSERFYCDITETAFRGNSSYELQLCHGADYWRTILDGASGIDIYGHNGISLGDIDGDGYDDLYICQAAGLPNRLYRNRGDGTFEDITEWSGLGLLDNTACALFADFSNRGVQDVLVVRAAGPLLFENQGKGKFKLKPDAFHFQNPPQGTFTGAAAADYNRDGLLDVYFCLYSYYQGTDQYKYPTPYFAAENGPPNYLMRNRGDATFEDVTASCGLDKNNTRYSFCCGWSDYNQDGWPDLYVVNDFGRKNLYRNNGDGTFTDVAEQAGASDVGAGMSVAWLDYDNDGKEDLYVANMWTSAGERLSHYRDFQQSATTSIKDLYNKHAMGNSLLKNSGATFTDATAKSRTGIGRWAWSSDGFDFDHDGLPDLYVANGMISGPVKEDLNGFFWREVVARSPNTFQSDADYEEGWKAINELIRSDYSWSGFERNVFFANNGDGTFSDVSGAVGLDLPEDGRAFAVGDFDGDGRQEIFLKNRNSPQLRLMKNSLSQLPSAIAFRLKGSKSNRDAIGASVTIGRQTRFLQAGSGFLSQHSKEVFFGLGKMEGKVSATIRWPSGLVQELHNLDGGNRVMVTEGQATYQQEPFEAFQMPSDSPLVAPEAMPDSFSTWLLKPILAPRLNAGWVCFRDASVPAASGCTDILVDDPANRDIWAVYNLLFRSIFDRHRDMQLPTYFLINQNREIVQICQGKQYTQTKALPFEGVGTYYEYGRNYLSLGSIFFQHGYAEYAQDFFEAALRQNPASAEASYGLGSACLKQGKNELAKDNFESAAKLRAEYPETTPNAWNNLGLLATRQGDTASAIGFFRKALAVDPNHFIALENLGNAYKQEKRWPEAKENLERALVIKPQDAEANYSLGMVFAQLDDIEHASDYLGKALKARPIYPEALNNLAILYLRTHRRDLAVSTFQHCIQVAPLFEQAYMNLARVYSIEGNTKEARAILNELLKQHPDSAAAKQALSQLP